jgi:hypothetical protein
MDRAENGNKYFTLLEALMDNGLHCYTSLDIFGVAVF